ncbi:MAG: hypothetical protein M3T56_19040 [Chloroflexota bacterium]|nr:hypothetical protein [Chloroflexota bacterium]
MVTRNLVTAVYPTGYETREEPTLDLLTLERSTRRLGLPSFDAVCAVALACDDLLPQIPKTDEPTGTRSDWVAAVVAEPILGTYIDDIGAVRFDRATFDRVFDQIAMELQSPATPYTAYAPIDNLTLPDGAVEVVAGIEMRPRDKEDLEQWINRGTPFERINYIGVETVLERPYLETVGEVRGARQSQDVIEQLMTAIQLHLNCDAYAAFVRFRCDATFHRSLGGTVTPAPHFGRQRGNLLRVHVGPIRELSERLGVSPNRTACELALGRWRSIAAGGSASSVIVDAWIGLESLLFRGGSSGEIIYRASLRLAALIGRDGADAQSVLRQARTAYNGRSKVLHGADTGKLDLPALAAVSRDFLRRALVAVLAKPTLFDPETIEHELLT